MNSNSNHNTIVNSYNFVRPFNGDAGSEWAYSTQCRSCRSNLVGQFYIFVSQLCNHWWREKCQLNITPFRPQCTTCIGFSAFRLTLVNRHYWTANNVVYYSDINPDIRLQPRFASHFEYN
jgi:hypothetical protein